MIDARLASQSTERPRLGLLSDGGSGAALPARDSILGEDELGGQGEDGAGSVFNRWVLDPIDGTTRVRVIERRVGGDLTEALSGGWPQEPATKPDHRTGSMLFLLSDEILYAERGSTALCWNAAVGPGSSSKAEDS